MSIVFINKGVIKVARKTHTTTIEDDIWDKFSNAVNNNGKNMNDVLEEFMKYYADGFEIIVTKKIQ